MESFFLFLFSCALVRFEFAERKMHLRWKNCRWHQFAHCMFALFHQKSFKWDRNDILQLFVFTLAHIVALLLDLSKLNF